MYKYRYQVKVQVSSIRCPGSSVKEQVYCNKYQVSILKVLAPSSKVPAQGQNPTKNPNSKLALPARLPPNHLKYDTWASNCPTTSEKASPNHIWAHNWHPARTATSNFWITNSIETAKCDWHLSSAASQHARTYVRKPSNSWCVATVYKTPAIIKISQIN